MTWNREFFDDFPAGPDVNRTRWRSPHWTPENNKAYIGRTGIRNPKDFQGELGLIPCTSQNGADLRLCTYNPKAEPRGSAFLGSEIHTVQKWGGNGETVKFEARVEAAAVTIAGIGTERMKQGGAVTSVFSYALCGQGGVQNEIDFEFASNHWQLGQQPEHFTNVFVCASGAGSGPMKQESNLIFGGYRTFSLIYTPSRSVEWLVDGTSLRKETEHVPDWRASGGMALYMNFWAPDSGWKWAYSENFKPVATSPGATWHYYVKSAPVYYEKT